MLLPLRHVCLALCLFTSVAGAQTLAHPGWRGNGIASEAWWKHAAFVRFGADTTFAEAAANMDAISEAGADCLILPDLLPAGSPQPDTNGIAHPFEASFGTQDDLDGLLREASARRMHVLLHVDLLRLAGNPGEVRFWMSRGIAGFDVGDVTPAQSDTLQLLRGAMDHFPGRRILLAHVPADTSRHTPNRVDVTLHLLAQGETTGQDGTWNALAVHTAAALKLPPPANTALIVDAALLTGEAAREDLRRTLAARTRSYSAGRSTRRRPR